MVLCQKLAQHRRVLVGHGSAELREHAGRQAKPGGDRIEVPGARARSGPDQQLMGLARRDDLFDERVDRGAAAIDHALSADLDHGGVRQDAEVRRFLCSGHELRVGERTLHQQPFELRDRVRHSGHPLAL